MRRPALPLPIKSSSVHCGHGPLSFGKLIGRLTGAVCRKAAYGMTSMFNCCLVLTTLHRDPLILSSCISLHGTWHMLVACMHLLIARNVSFVLTCCDRCYIFHYGSSSGRTFAWHSCSPGAIPLYGSYFHMLHHDGNDARHGSDVTATATAQVCCAKGFPCTSSALPPLTRTQQSVATRACGKARAAHGRP